MSTFAFRPAKRSEAKPLIGLYSESGCGKTLSALLLARGFVGPSGRIGMIETESGRGEVYEDDPRVGGGYLVCPIRENFSPREYGEALTAAEKADLGALIIDSASHEWEGAGGVLSMAAQNQAAGKKGQLVWQGPKLDHQRYFMLRLMQTPIPLVVVCMRAKYPMEEVVVNGKKEWVRSTTLAPKQSEDILYELMAHGWIDQAHRFRGTKYTRDDLKAVLVDGQPISIETGRRLAAWARGGAVGVTSAQSATQSPGAPEPVDTREASPPDRATVMQGISDAVGRWQKAPPDALWRTLCRDVCGAEDIETVDVAALADLLDVCHGYARGHAAARKRVHDLARTLQVAAA